MDEIKKLQNLLKSLAFKDDVFSPRALSRQVEFKALVENTTIGEMRTYKEKLYALLNNDFTLPRCECGEPCSFKSTTTGFNMFCSVKCAQSSEKTKLNRTKGIQDKYGVSNVRQLKSVKDKIKAHLTQHKIEIINAKKKATVKKRYGVDNVAQASIVKEKISQTNIDRYGDASVLKVDSVRAKIESTCLKKYGSKHAMQSTRVQALLKDGMISRHGVKHNSQLESTKVKRRLSLEQSYKDKILPVRLKQMEELGYIPHEWVAADFNTCESSYKFKHIACNTVFDGKFFNGTFSLCPKCVTSNRSSLEELLCTELLKRNIHIESNNRTIIKPQEIDIICNNKLGIEINGVYWHQAEKSKPILDKLTRANNAGYQLLHFWDYEIIHKLPICISMICAKLNIFDNKIAARKCKIVKLTTKQARIFFNDNHLQGFIPGENYIGLEHNNNIVMAAIFGKSRFQKGKIELYRLASEKHYSITGGFAKILSSVEFQTLISYADKRYSSGDVYKRHGFQFIRETPPNYYWVKGNDILTRYKTQKHKLKKLFPDCDLSLSESEILQQNGYLKIKDCGNIVFELKK